MCCPVGCDFGGPAVLEPRPWGGAGERRPLLILIPVRVCCLLIDWLRNMWFYLLPNRECFFINLKQSGINSSWAGGLSHGHSGSDSIISPAHLGREKYTLSTVFLVPQPDARADNTPLQQAASARNTNHGQLWRGP